MYYKYKKKRNIQINSKNFLIKKNYFLQQFLY